MIDRCIGQTNAALTTPKSRNVSICIDSMADRQMIDVILHMKPISNYCREVEAPTNGPVKNWSMMSLTFARENKR
jgi:hypothetical protein